MVIDSSVVCSILLGEAQRASFLDAIRSSPTRLMSALNVFEAATVLMFRLSGDAASDVDEFVRALHIDVVPFDRIQATLAADVYKRYGKGKHKASLNFGDCVAYALGEYHHLPLLCKGDNFSQTPIRKFLRNPTQ